MIGLKPDGRLAVFERTFPRCMGVGVDPTSRSLFLATHFQLIRFDNVTHGSQAEHDAVFAPHLSWITGDLDVHEVAVASDGRPIFINTLFSCVATVSDGYSFRPLWKPPFISKLAPEDRCHLNGLALDDGKPRYVTLVAPSDVADGWRDQRANGGLLMDITTDEIVTDGLSMPHSPRMQDGKVWLLNSGSGELGYVEPENGRFEPVAFCPGYARGLTFIGSHAIVGLSLQRENRTFQGLALDQGLIKRGAEPRCGLIVVDTTNGDTIGWIRIEGVVRELFDVAVLPGVRNPALVGFKTDEIRRVISIDETSEASEGAPQRHQRRKRP